MRDETETEYFLDVHEYSWTGTVGQPAGVYWIGGRSVIAAHASRAEQQLLQQGAILVATLLFGRDPLESRQPGSTVERVPAAAIAAALEPPSGN